MATFYVLDDRTRTMIKDWRGRVHVDNNILTANNFAALLDFIAEKDRLWQSIQSPVDMNDINRKDSR